MKFKPKTTWEENGKLSFNQRLLLSNTDSSPRNLTESFFVSFVVLSSKNAVNQINILVRSYFAVK